MPPFEKRVRKWGTGRGKLLNLCFHPETHEQVEWLAQRWGVSKTEAVRQSLMLVVNMAKESDQKTEQK